MVFFLRLLFLTKKLRNIGRRIKREMENTLESLKTLENRTNDLLSNSPKNKMLY
jgi:hypothetical protein